MLIHWTIVGLRSSLTLCSCRRTWSLNFTVQSWRLATCPSKILAFLRFQISHAAIMKISVKKVTPNCRRPYCRRVCISFELPQSIPNFCQQAAAKGQSKKRCLRSSTTPALHITQWLFGWTWKFLLCSISLVFSLSMRISQAKNLSLGVHLDFQTHLKVLGSIRCLKASW